MIIKESISLEEYDNTTDNKVDVTKKKDTRSNMFLSIFNIANCSIGSGILALPYSSQKAGLPITLILTAVSCIVSIHTCMLIVSVAKQTKTRNYLDAVESSLGSVAKIILSLCTILFPSFCSIAYGIAITDNLSMVLEHLFPEIYILQNRILILCLCLVLVIIPLSLPKHLSFLDKASTVSLLFVIFYSIVFIYKFPLINSKIMILEEEWKFASIQGLPQAMAIIFGSFTIHHNVIPLYYGLRKSTIERFSINLVSSMALALLLYYICTLVGFISFYGTARSNLLNNYCVSDLLMFVTRIIFTGTIILTYPFQIFAARDTIITLLQTKYSINKWMRYAISLALIIVLSVISMSSKSVGSIFEIGNSLVAYPLLMIFPCLAYMKTFYSSLKPTTIHMVVLWFIIIFGVVLMITGLTLSIRDIFTTHEYEQEKYWC